MFLRGISQRLRRGQPAATAVARMARRSIASYSDIRAQKADEIAKLVETVQQDLFIGKLQAGTCELPPGGHTLESVGMSADEWYVVVVTCAVLAWPCP